MNKHINITGDRLRILRKALELTQKQVAETIGISQNLISEHENNISRPGYDNLLKYADLYKTTVDYIMGRTSDPSPPIIIDDPPGLAYLLARQNEYLTSSESRITEEERQYLRQAPGSFSVSGYLLLLRVMRDQLEKVSINQTR